MADICRETAKRIHAIMVERGWQDSPADLIEQIAGQVHEAMFRAHFCRPRCESETCEQANGGSE